MISIFPIALISLNFLASIGYLLTGDVLKCVYWGCATGINVCVYLMKG